MTGINIGPFGRFDLKWLLLSLALSLNLVPAVSLAAVTPSDTPTPSPSFTPDAGGCGALTGVYSGLFNSGLFDGDGAGNVFAADDGGVMVRRYASGGAQTLTFTAGGMAGAWAAAVDKSSGDVFVNDRSSGKVYHFDAAAGLVGSFGTPDSFSTEGLAVGPTGDLYLPTRRCPASSS